MREFQVGDRVKFVPRNQYNNLGTVTEVVSRRTIKVRWDGAVLSRIYKDSLIKLAKHDRLAVNVDEEIVL